MRQAVNKAANTPKGPLGNAEVIKPFEKLVNRLSSLSRSREITFSDGVTATVKPNLIIRSNDVSYKFANLERIKKLTNNYSVFVAAVNLETGCRETSVRELARKISELPAISPDNMAFIIRLPKDNISAEEKSVWDNRMRRLKDIVGEENVTYNPSKKEFIFRLNNSSKEVIAVHLTHTKLKGTEGIEMENGEVFNSKDFQSIEDLSNVKFMLSIACKMVLLENGKLESAFRNKGVGILNAPSHLAPTDINGKRIDELIKLLKMKDIKKHKIYPHQILDIIDQRLKLPGKKSINLGKRKINAGYSPA